jgi:hypothetical protein
VAEASGDALAAVFGAALAAACGDALAAVFGAALAAAFGDALAAAFGGATCTSAARRLAKVNKKTADERTSARMRAYATHGLPFRKVNFETRG